jgi:hypothetical protein
MILAVIGSRTFNNYIQLKCELDLFKNITMIISGGAQGADTLAERYAKEHDIELRVYYPDWKTYGRKAGPLRNIDIVSAADYVVAFWDGVSPGTKSSIDIAKKLNKPYRIINI